MIGRRLAVGPFESNCYIMGADNKEGIVIDPGADAKMILEGIKEDGLNIRFIVLTHGHIDHVGALTEVKQATGATLAIHADETETLLQTPYANSMWGLDYPTPPPPDKLLHDGDRITVGDLDFMVLHTPGHTQGGICLLLDGVVFTGDTLFNQGIGRTDMPGGSYEQLLNSIHTKLMTLPDETVVYPGHGPESTIGQERRSNPFLSGQQPF